MSTNSVFSVADHLSRDHTEMIHLKVKYMALSGFNLEEHYKVSRHNNHVFPVGIAYHIKYVSGSLVKCYLNDFKYCKN